MVGARYLVEKLFADGKKNHSHTHQSKTNIRVIFAQNLKNKKIDGDNLWACTRTLLLRVNSLVRAVISINRQALLGCNNTNTYL